MNMCPPVTCHFIVKSLCKNMARASGGAQIICTHKSWGREGQKRKRSKNYHRKNDTFKFLHTSLSHYTPSPAYWAFFVLYYRKYTIMRGGGGGGGVDQESFLTRNLFCEISITKANSCCSLYNLGAAVLNCGLCSLRSCNSAHYNLHWRCVEEEETGTDHSLCRGRTTTG